MDPGGITSLGTSRPTVVSNPAANKYLITWWATTRHHPQPWPGRWLPWSVLFDCGWAEAKIDTFFQVTAPHYGTRRGTPTRRSARPATSLSSYSGNSGRRCDRLSASAGDD